MRDVWLKQELCRTMIELKTFAMPKLRERNSSEYLNFLDKNWKVNFQ